jgi:peptidylprolyl isomerase
VGNLHLVRTFWLSIVLATSTLLAAGCGSDTKQPSGAGGCEVQVSGDQGKKPDVTVPNCAAPTALQTKDLIAGTGEPVKDGDTVEVNYTLYGWDGKKLVQSSYDGGQTFPVQDVGHAQVIDGWNKGLVGLKQGGRRLLVVPPDLGYGAQGTPDGSIKPNEALVFVIDAVAVRPAQAGPKVTSS